MKKSLFTRFNRPKARGEEVEKTIATSDDVRKKLENYKKGSGRADFGSAGLYHVNEVEESESTADEE